MHNQLYAPQGDDLNDDEVSMFIAVDRRISYDWLSQLTSYDIDVNDPSLTEVLYEGVATYIYWRAKFEKDGVSGCKDLVEDVASSMGVALDQTEAMRWGYETFYYHLRMFLVALEEINLLTPWEYVEDDNGALAGFIATVPNGWILS